MTHPTALEVREALLKLANSGAWRTYDGPNLEALRYGLQLQFQRQYVRLCSSGTFGIELAIRSLKLATKSEVLLAGYDYPGNFRSIEDAGASVALVDLGADGWTLTPESLDRALGPNSRAVVVSHLHGQLANMEAICDWARERNIFVIEDACQEPGATFGPIDHRKPVGSFGDLSVLSFGGSKPLSAGRGGAVMTNDPQLAQRMTIYCERGNDAYALSELQAAVLTPQLTHLIEDSSARRNSAIKLLQQLESIPWLKHPHGDLTSDHAHDNAASYYKLGLQLDSTGLQGTTRIPFANAFPETDQECCVVFRDFLLQQFSEIGLKIGAGFRGFLGRSKNRCRQPLTMPFSLNAAQSTIVIDHSHLLCPEKGSSSIKSILDALETINKMMNL